jgi:cytoskeletal protein CcmA (bactofilin family)
MFKKRTDGPEAGPLTGALALSAPSDGARKAPKTASVIGDAVTIDGSVSGDGELQLDGTLRGDVFIERLFIGETGHLEGSVTADVVEVRGRVLGTITARQVRLHGTAHVDGDITHEQLSMEPGAFFQGRSMKFQRQIPAPTEAETGAEAF